MPAPILASPLVLPGVVGIASSKKAENKRRQAAANEFSKKYPLGDDYSAIMASLNAAKSELQAIKNSTAKNAGERRVKARNILMLSKWIEVMNGHAKDLKVGVNIASSQVRPTTPTPAAAAAAPAPDMNTISQPVVGASEGKQTPDVAPKGKPNWILIGGVALGVFVVYKLLKK
jgi:hypothetical protein